MNTLYINLFGGPGTGKSTSAAGLFYKLKTHGINAELIQEYAKDKTWAEDVKTLSFQPYILGKQLYRQFRVKDMVDVAVTDSPILLSAVYTQIYNGFGTVDGFEDVIVKQSELFDNMNIFLLRNSEEHPYNPAGRSQTKEEAINVDKIVLDLLEKHHIDYRVLEVSKHGHHIDQIFDMIMKRIEK